MRITQRAQRVEPFYVMELAKAAQAMAEQAGPDARRMIYLNIGEPDFTAPPLVQPRPQWTLPPARCRSRICIAAP